MGISAPSVVSGVTLSGSNGKAPFLPKAVSSFEETGLSHAIIEGLVLKFLVNAGTVWSGTTMVAFRFGYFRSLGSLELEQALLQKVLSARRETVNAFAKELLATGSTLVRYLPEEPE